MTTNLLIKMWQTAAQDLNMELIAPYTLPLPNGDKIQAEFLLKNFGAVNGMIVVKRFDQVSSLIDEIIKEGYGFSVLEEPSEKEKYLREDFIEILNDWGWSGKKEKIGKLGW